MISLGSSIGIDFGSADATAYAWRDGQPLRVTPDATVPAWIFLGAREVVVGRAARERATLEPRRCVYGIKRLLGRKFHAPEVDWIREVLPIDLVPADNGDAWLRVGEDDLSPEQVAAELLGYLRTQAESTLGEVVTGATIAIPAYADIRQRAAIIASARIAGFDDVSLVGEPYAAIAALTPRRLAPGTNAVLCVGAGTFDVLLVERQGDEVRALTVAGDTVLGLDDVDRRLVTLLIEGARPEPPKELSRQPDALVHLARIARAQRRALEEGRPPAPIDIAELTRTLAGPVAFRHRGLDFEQMESVAIAELERMADPCAWALEDAGIGTADLASVLLVGGGGDSRLVRDNVQFLFQREAEIHSDPGLVGRGAARLAAGAANAVAPAAPHSLGMRVRGGRMSPVIHRNATLPTRQQKVFAPTRKDQSLMMLEVYQGEAELVTDNTYLGRFVLGGQGAIGRTAVHFELDHNGILAIATEEQGASCPLPLQASGGLAPEDIEAMAAERRATNTPSSPPRGKHRSGGFRLARRPGKARSSAPVTHGRKRRVPAAGRTTVAPRAPGEKRSVPPLLSHTDPDRTVPDMPPPPATPGAIETPTDPLVGSVLGGRYAIEEVVAEGGMGRVYRARHTVLNRGFAIKVLHAELADNDEMNARFVLEAQAASSIRNEHVVDISDFGRLEDGTGYFVMEYLEGDTLADAIRAAGHLPADMIIEVGIQLSRGLRAAHELGIVHRDLKPENVTVLRRDGGAILCKILDFGIAKSPTTDSAHRLRRITMAGVVLGTPLYMAPEQIMGEPVDARTDLYALGAVLYEMATGHPPFEAKSIAELLTKHREATPGPIRARPQARSFPKPLERLILRCLAKAPEERFASARDFEDALASL